MLAESALDRLVNSAHDVIFRGRTYRPLRRPDRGHIAAVEDPDGSQEQQPRRPRQKRARESAQDVQNDGTMTSDTSGDDGSATTERRT